MQVNEHTVTRPITGNQLCIHNAKQISRFLPPLVQVQEINN